MRTLLEIAAKTISEDKAKHIAAGGTSGAGVLANGSIPTADGILGALLVWTPHVAVFVGLAVSCAILYKTYLDIRLARMKLQETDDGKD